MAPLSPSSVQSKPVTSPLFCNRCSQLVCSVRKRIYDTFNPISLERMLAFHRDTIMGMVAEAENREVKKILNLEDYTEFRILQGAMPSMFDLMECCFNFIVPDKVHSDPVFKLMHREATIIVLWTNVSQNKIYFQYANDYSPCTSGYLLLQQRAKPGRSRILQCCFCRNE